MRGQQGQKKMATGGRRNGLILLVGARSKSVPLTETVCDTQNRFDRRVTQNA